MAKQFLGGETLHGFAKRHDVSFKLIRVWIDTYKAGDYDDGAEAEAADLLSEYEARIAALKWLAGR